MGWTVHLETAQRGAKARLRRCFVVISAAQAYLARLPLSRGQEAHLMAAAPDLLEALEELADCPDPRHASFTERMRKAYAAIAKARDYPCADCGHPAFEHNESGCSATVAGAGAGRMGIHSTTICWCQKYLRPGVAII